MTEGCYGGLRYDPGMSQNVITINPDPPVAGQPLEICYTFNDEIQSVTLLVQFTNSPPPPTSMTVVLTPGDRCKTIPVPATAVGFAIEDQDGGANEIGGGVNEPTSDS